MTVPSKKRKLQKTVNFGSSVFVPIAESCGVGKKADPQLVSAPKIQRPSTPAAFPSKLVSTKLTKMVLDKFSGNLLECPEWAGQFLATVDECGAADNMLMKYLKTLVTGKRKTAIEGIDYASHLHHMARQTLEGDFGWLELVVNAHS